MQDPTICQDATFFAEVLRVSRQVWLENVVEILMTDGGGLKRSEYLARSGQDGSSLKTLQGSSLSKGAKGSKKYSRRLPRSAIAFSTYLCELPTLAHRIKERGSSFADTSWQTPRMEGFDAGRHRGRADSLPSQVRECQSQQNWPTPDANLFNDGQSVEAYEARKARELEKGYNGNGGGTPLAMAVRLPDWPTPQAYSHSQDTNPPGITKLDIQVRGMYPDNPKYWPIPTASPNANRNMSPCPSHGVSHGRVLASEVNRPENWATPTGGDARSGGNRNGPGSSCRPGVSLTDQVVRGISYESIRKSRLEEGYEAWPTPTSRDWRSGKASSETMEGNRRPLNEVATAIETELWSTPAAADHKGPKTFADGTSLSLDEQTKQTRPAGSTGWLNPAWVETLMMFPIGWTQVDGSGLRARVSRKSHGNQDEHLKRPRKESEGSKP